MPVPDVAVPAEQPAESPTGKPVIPPALMPYVAGIVAVALVGAQTFPEHTIAARICTGIVMVGSVLGLVSPGWRRKPTQ